MAERTVAVITGGRSYEPARGAADRLLEAIREEDVVAVFEGSAKGCDRWAGGVVRRARAAPVHTIPALWNVDGRKAAGPRRNARMLRWACQLAADIGAEVVVLQYPGGRGTANMCEQAEARGVEIIEMERGLRVVPERRKR